MENIDGYVTKDSIYRLLSDLRIRGEIDDRSSSTIVKAICKLGKTDMGNVRLIDANALKEYKCSNCLERLRCKDRETVCSEIFEIDEQPTIEAQPVNTDKCKALRNIEGIRLILSNVYNTGSTLQDCDYDAIFKRLDVIENILKGK